jgi:hypothetical protein
MTYANDAKQHRVPNAAGLKPAKNTHIPSVVYDGAP